MEEILGGLIEDMSNDDYHARTDWLSSSMLKGYLPEHYKSGGSQQALDFGTLFHTAVLEPALLDAYVPLDAAKIGVKADGTPAQSPTMTAAWKKACAEVAADGKTVVDQADMDKALAMREAVLAHETAAQLLTAEGRNELSAFATDERGVRHKARFDRLIAGAAVDLKSTSAKPGEDSLVRAVIDYGYDLSAAHYMTVADLLGLDVQAFALIFVGKEEPYRVTVCDVGPSFLERGHLLREQAIARHLKTAPAYEGETGYLTLHAPEWALRKASAA